MAPSALLLLLSLLSFAASEEVAEKASLLKLKQMLGGNRLPWNQSTPLCSWYGVNCTTDGAIVELRLPFASLTGTIPTGVFGNLPSLRVLILSSNALSGSLPSDLASCTQLQQLLLQENRLSGDFPTVILSLSSLTRLILAGNDLSGPIPAALSNLKNLVELDLEHNRFSGELPDLDLPKLERFNVSHNRLNGSVPLGLRGQPAEAFLGMPLCGGPLPACAGEGKKGKVTGGAMAVVVVMGIIVVLLGVSVAVLLCCKRDRRDKVWTPESGIDPMPL